LGKEHQLADGLTIEVVQADILTFAADAVLLKYAGGLHGADGMAARALQLRDSDLDHDLFREGSHRLVTKNRGMAAAHVLFVSVGHLYEFRYDEIRKFARDGLAILKSQPVPVRHVALTSHGANYGLDEVQAFESLVRGLFDAWKARDVPSRLERISIVEMRPRRADRFTAELPRIIEELGERKQAPDARPHVFVAMPFAEEFDDTYYYAIEPPVRDSGCLCERVDTQTFSGDILEQIRTRISSARYVVADLSTANANVYLEVGYAWGKGRPTILLCRDVKDLRFDVQSQRCIIYKSIRDLETKLRKELAQLDAVKR
jgi:hypothetical protein